MGYDSKEYLCWVLTGRAGELRTGPSLMFNISVSRDNGTAGEAFQPQTAAENDICKVSAPMSTRAQSALQGFYCS